MSAIRRTLVAQFHQPTGFLGRIAGSVMARRSSNRERNRWTVSLLEIEPDHHILEVGFGPGLAIEQASRLATRGRVAGIDHSEVMWRAASRRNRSAIARGGVELHCGSVTALPELGRFDRIFTVNCLMFWPDPVATLRDLRALMKPSATLAVTHQPRNAGASETDVERAEGEIRELFDGAGIEPTRCERLALRPVPAICVLGRAV